MVTPSLSATQTSSATTAQTITITAPGAGKQIVLLLVVGDVSASTTLATLKYGSTTLMTSWVPVAGRIYPFGNGFACPENTAVTLDFAAPGSGTTTGTIFYNVVQ